MKFKKVISILLTAVLLFSFHTGTIRAEEEISRLVLSKNELSMEIGDIQSLTATAVYVSGRTEDVTVKTDWTSGTPSVASIYAGTISAKSEGTAVITATYMGKTVIVNVSVHKKIKNLSKNKQSIAIRTGVREQIQLTALYTDGTQEDITNKADWSVDNEAVATVLNGLVTGQGSGTATVTAKYGNQVTEIPVSVEIVNRLDPSKTQVSLLLKGTEKVELLATFPDGTVEDVAEKAEWSTDKADVADALKGVITAYGPGVATITAKYGTKTASIKVDVDTTRKLEIDKQSVFMHVNSSEQLKLTATYANGATEDITAKAQWSSSNESVAYAKEGTVQAYSSGEAVITAKYGDKSVQVYVDVEVPRRLEASKDYVSLRAGDTEPLILKATYADGTTKEVTNQAQWSSSNESVAYASAGKIMAFASGETKITASYGGKTVTITVDVDIPLKLTASKESVSLQVGDGQQVNVTAVYSDGREENVTESAEWTTGSPEIAGVRKGFVTGVGTGAATITAKYGTRSVTIPVSVGVVQKLTADKTKLVLSKGGSATVKLTAAYTDGTTKDVTTLAAWTTADANVAEVDSGTVTAAGSGQTKITAAFENKTVTVPVEVDWAQSLKADLKIAVLGINESKQITLTATDSEGNSKNVTGEAEWRSSSPAVADVSEGLVTGYSRGKATISAKYGGKTITIPAEVEILQKLEANKRFIQLKTGSEVQITLTATYSNGSTKNVTQDAEWKTGSFKVADVEKGLVVGTGYGKTTITAKYGGKTVSIPVESDQLKYLKTNAVLLEMKKGETKQVTAIATYTDNTEQDVTVRALWTTSKLLVADVKDGLIQAHSPGKATITVTYAGKKTQVVVTVAK